MAVPPSLEQAVSDLLNKCTECGICQRVCPFLQKYGLPKEILLKEKEEVFLLHQLQSLHTPLQRRFRPQEALFSLKVKLLKKESPLGKSLREGALGFVKRIHSFPFSHWEKTERVFWPGWSFYGTYPHLINRILHILNKNSKKQG